jgi:hypothetical protein
MGLAERDVAGGGKRYLCNTLILVLGKNDLFVVDTRQILTYISIIARRINKNYSRYSLGMKFLAHLSPKKVVIICRERFIAAKLEVGRGISEKTPLGLR